MLLLIPALPVAPNKFRLPGPVLAKSRTGHDGVFKSRSTGNSACRDPAANDITSSIHRIVRGGAMPAPWSKTGSTIVTTRRDAAAMT